MFVIDVMFEMLSRVSEDVRRSKYVIALQSGQARQGVIPVIGKISYYPVEGQ